MLQSSCVSVKSQSSTITLMPSPSWSAYVSTGSSFVVYEEPKTGKTGDVRCLVNRGSLQWRAPSFHNRCSRCRMYSRNSRSFEEGFCCWSLGVVSSGLWIASIASYCPYRVLRVFLSSFLARQDLFCLDVPILLVSYSSEENYSQWRSIFYIRMISAFELPAFAKAVVEQIHVVLLEVPDFLECFLLQRGNYFPRCFHSSRSLWCCWGDRFNIDEDHFIMDSAWCLVVPAIF